MLEVNIVLFCFVCLFGFFFKISQNSIHSERPKMKRLKALSWVSLHRSPLPFRYEHGAKIFALYDLFPVLKDTPNIINTDLISCDIENK